jgi:hypothetical protein
MRCVTARGGRPTITAIDKGELQHRKWRVLEFGARFVGFSNEAMPGCRMKGNGTGTD